MSTTTAGDSRTGTIAISPQRRDWRTIVFRGVALLITFFVLGLSGMATNLLAPWALIGPFPASDYTPELHRWHSVDIAALFALLVCGSLLALLPRPRRAPLLAQFILLALGIAVAVGVWPFAAEIVIPCVVIAILFIASYPGTRALVTVRGADTSSRPLLALAVLAGLPLLCNAWTDLHLQHTDLSEHAHNFHWTGGGALALTLAVGGFLVASRRPGWRILGTILSLTYLYLGGAALTIPSHDGSWGYAGGALALVGAVGFCGLTFVEGRHTRAARQ